MCCQQSHRAMRRAKGQCTDRSVVTAQNAHVFDHPGQRDQSVDCSGTGQRITHVAKYQGHRYTRSFERPAHIYVVLDSGQPSVIDTEHTRGLVLLGQGQLGECLRFEGIMSFFGSNPASRRQQPIGLGRQLSIEPARGIDRSRSAQIGGAIEEHTSLPPILAQALYRGWALSATNYDGISISGAVTNPLSIASRNVEEKVSSRVRGRFEAGSSVIGTPWSGPMKGRTRGMEQHEGPVTVGPLDATNYKAGMHPVAVGDLEYRCHGRPASR